MDQTQKIARQTTLDRLTEQRDALRRHMADLEQQLRDAGNHMIAIQEHITRLRGSIEKIYTKD